MPLTPEQRSALAEVMRNVNYATQLHQSPLSTEMRTTFATAALAQALAVAAEVAVTLADAIREQA